MERLMRGLAEHPFACLLATVLLSAAAWLQLFGIEGGLVPRLAIDPSIERLLPAHDEDREVYARARATFGDSDAILVAVRFDNVFRAETIARIDRLTRRLATLPGVRQVSSLANAQNPIAEGAEIELSTFAAQAEADPASVARFRDDIAANPLYRGALVSADGRTAVFVVALADMDEAEFTRLDLPSQLRLAAAEVTGASEIWITGSAVVKAATTRALLDSMQFTIPAIFALVIVLLSLAFRSLRAMLIGTLTIALALLWTLATVAFLEVPFNLVTVIVPPLVITLCLSYSVHMLSEYFGDTAGGTMPQRVARVLNAIIVPTLLTTLTTILGFLALLVNDLPAIRQFVLLASLGVLYSLALVLVFLPAALRLAGVRRSRGPIAERRFQVAARALARFDVRRRRWIIGVALVLLPVDLWFASNIQVGTEYIKGLDEQAQVRRDYEAINRALNGASIVSILIETHVNDALTDPALIRQIESLQGWLLEQPEVGAAVSYVDHLKLINRNLNEGDPLHYAIPADAGTVKQLLVFGGSEEIRRAIDSRFRTALLTVRINVDGSIPIADFVRRTEARIRTMPPPLNAQVTGAPVLATRTVNEIAAGQWQSLAIALGLIFLILWMLFTSARAAAAAMLPNLLPVGLYFGTLGALGIPLNPTNSMIACIVLGIAADDTIHFLARFNADARAKASEQAAVKSALAKVLRPISLTALTMCLGFLVFTGSELQNQQQFGLLAAFTMALSWLSNITVTPALGSRLRIVTLWDLVRLDLGQSPQHTIPLLSGLSTREARIFALMSRLEKHHEGARVIRQGDVARDMYVVVDGTLEAWIERHDERKTLATMGRGAVMGEAGYFGQRRTAHVDALTPVRVLRFDSQDLERLRARYPRIAATIYRNLNRIQAERLARATAMLQ